MSTDPLTAQAMALHRESIVIDGTSFFCHGYSERLERAGLTAFQCTTAWPDDDLPEAVRRIEGYYALARRDPKMAIVERADDIPRLKKEGRVGIIITFQNARPVGSVPERVETFWRLGVRTLQMTYNERNFYGEGCMEETGAGLSTLGREVVREMNRAGILIDLSHVGYRTSMDTIEHSEKPCIFSHSNPYSRVPVPRNIKDDQIKAVAARGGLVGLSPYPPLNWRGGPEPPGLNDLLDNIDYVVDLIGIDHVMFGTDSEATKGAYPPDLSAWLRQRYAVTVGGFHERFPKGTPLAGFENGMEDLPNITRGLLERGYKPEDVKKFLGENYLQLVGSVWK